MVTMDGLRCTNHLCFPPVPPRLLPPLLIQGHSRFTGREAETCLSCPWTHSQYTGRKVLRGVYGRQWGERALICALKGAGPPDPTPRPTLPVCLFTTPSGVVRGFSWTLEGS